MEELLSAVARPLHEPSLASSLLVAAQVGAILAVDTFVFDVIHWTLHAFDRSGNRFLAWLYTPHRIHHEFLDRELRFHDELTAKNILMHNGGELGTQLLVSACFLLVAQPLAVAGAWLIHLGWFAVVVAVRGRDANHVPFEQLRAPRSGLFVGARYHALHHVHPNSYFSSGTTLFDRLFGSACQIEGRRFVVTGARGAFGSALIERLRAEGAAVETLQHERDFDASGPSEAAREVLARADVLVLSHGVKRGPTMEVNHRSFVALCGAFLELTRQRRFPVEVWALGSEAELHPAFGEVMKAYRASKLAYARYARRLMHDDRLVYRHIVPSAFRSRMGFGLISARTAARVALFFIKRGFRYVPVTYTGIALLNWLAFAWPLARGREATR